MNDTWALLQHEHELVLYVLLETIVFRILLHNHDGDKDGFFHFLGSDVAHENDVTMKLCC